MSALNLNLQKEVERHKGSKLALMKSEERFRAYFEENIAAAYISTPEGRLVTCNKEYLRIFGFKDKQHALDTDIPNVYHTSGEREQFLATLIRDKHVFGYETTLKRTDENCCTSLKTL